MLTTTVTTVFAHYLALILTGSSIKSLFLAISF